MNDSVRFAVADNLDDELVDRLVPYPVDEIYGRIPDGVVGGGRLSMLLPKTGRGRFSRHVAAIHGAGVSYNYLLNGACLDNIEVTRRGQKKIRGTLDWIVSIGIRRVTVANILLLKLIKRCYPEIKVRISVFAGVDSVPKARMWEGFGADCITLDSIAINREFEVLKAIRESLSIDLQLLVNNSCNMFCALSPTHMTFLAHGSQKGHHSGGFAPDYCFLYCSGMKLERPENFIRSDWIRPEDLERYIKMGYTNFKLTERGASTGTLLMRTKAYHEREYDGNLLDLVQPFAYPAVAGERLKWSSLLSLFLRGFRPLKANPARLAILGKLALYRNMLSPLKGEPPVFVDNAKLDGFMERFESEGCRGTDCDRCGHCHRWAEKAVSIDEEYRNRSLDLYGKAAVMFESGSLWRYR